MATIFNTTEGCEGLNTKRVKEYCFVAAFAIAFYLALSNLQKLSGVFSMVIGLLTPFIIGIILAFLLGGVMRKFEQKVFVRLASHPKKRVQKLVRPLSLICTYLLLFALLALLISVVVPQLVASVRTLVDNVPPFVDQVSKWLMQYGNWFALNPEIQQQLYGWVENLVETLINFVPELIGMVPQLYNLVVSVGGGVFTGVMGLILSIYMLLDKERILSQLSRISRAFLPAKAADYAAETALITVSTFENYVGGQLLDAMIVGTVSVAGLAIFGFPYAMLVGVVMGITNIIPFFGPVLGAIPGFLIIATASPTKALWYILFVVVIQQIDGNLLVPRIIGDSVGLPPLWVLFSVIVGGGIFGIPGMILGTPVFAVFYRLLGRAVRNRETAQVE